MPTAYLPFQLPHGNVFPSDGPFVFTFRNLASMSASSRLVVSDVYLVLVKSQNRFIDAL